MEWFVAQIFDKHLHLVFRVVWILHISDSDKTDIIPFQQGIFVLGRKARAFHFEQV